MRAVVDRDERGQQAARRVAAEASRRRGRRFQASHLALFRASGRRLGTRFGGVKVLFLHHFGAKSGAERISPLLYVEDGPNLAIIASKGGHDPHPAWYYNLKAHPDVEVEIAARAGYVHARRPRARSASGSGRRRHRSGPTTTATQCEHRTGRSRWSCSSRAKPRCRSRRALRLDRRLGSAGGTTTKATSRLVAAARALISARIELRVHERDLGEVDHDVALLVADGVRGAHPGSATHSRDRTRPLSRNRHVSSRLAECM